MRDFVYGFFEQKHHDYELLSLILHDAKTPQVRILKGLLSGIGVKNEASFIAARPVIVMRRPAIDSWQSLVGNELGYFPLGKVPEIVRRGLSREGVTVSP